MNSIVSVLAVGVLVFYLVVGLAYMALTLRSIRVHSMQDPFQTIAEVTGTPYKRYSSFVRLLVILCIVFLWPYLVKQRQQRNAKTKMSYTLANIRKRKLKEKQENLVRNMVKSLVYLQRIDPDSDVDFGELAKELRRYYDD